MIKTGVAGLCGTQSPAKSPAMFLAEQPSNARTYYSSKNVFRQRIRRRLRCLSRSTGGNRASRAHCRAPRSGRGGRRLKSCHSDQHLAEIKTLTGTDCGTVSRVLLAFWAHQSLTDGCASAARRQAPAGPGVPRPAFGGAVPTALWVRAKAKQSRKIDMPGANLQTTNLGVGGSNPSGRAS